MGVINKKTVLMTNNLLEKFFLKPNLYYSREVLDTLRFILLKKQLLHAYKNIPYYKIVFDNAGINPIYFKSMSELSNYPIITKDIIRLNSSRLLNQKALFRNRFKSHTSGSTGQPTWTYYNLTSWIRKKYIIKARARMECGVKPFEKIVVFDSTSLDTYESESIFFRTFKSRYKVFSIFEHYEKTIRKLIAFSPSALYGSPSHFFQLAQYINANNLRLTSVKKIFTSSEYLQDNVREHIKKIFNAEIYDIYGSTEFKEVAWECEKHEGYHINEDEVIVEVLKDGIPISPGRVGNVVITDLRNSLMPLIRFKLHDKGILIKEKCSCGRTFSLMKPYAGRLSEYIILPNNEILSPYLFTTSIEKIDGLLQYQIVQIDKETLLVNIVTDSKDLNMITNKVKSVLSFITNNLLRIEVQQKSELNIEENGKFKVVKNLILEQKESNHEK